MSLNWKESLVSLDNLRTFVSSTAVAAADAVVVVVAKNWNTPVQMTVDNMTEDRHCLYQCLHSMANE